MQALLWRPRLPQVHVPRMLQISIVQLGNSRTLHFLQSALRAGRLPTAALEWLCWCMIEAPKRLHPAPGSMQLCWHSHLALPAMPGQQMVIL